jgi:hypothetical protein
MRIIIVLNRGTARVKEVAAWTCVNAELKLEI